MNGRCERRVDCCRWKNLKEDNTKDKKRVGGRVIDGLWGLFVRIDFGFGRL